MKCNFTGSNNGHSPCVPHPEAKQNFHANARAPRNLISIVTSRTYERKENRHKLNVSTYCTRNGKNGAVSLMATLGKISASNMAPVDTGLHVRTLSSGSGHVSLWKAKNKKIPSIIAHRQNFTTCSTIKLARAAFMHRVHAIIKGSMFLCFSAIMMECIKEREIQH